MSNMKIVQDFINTASEPYCDDCLSVVLNIKPRQQVNQICNNLKKEGAIKRKVSQCCHCSKDKLINF